MKPLEFFEVFVSVDVSMSVFSLYVCLYVSMSVCLCVYVRNGKERKGT